MFTGVSDSLLEGRNLPVPAVPASARPLSEPFFGRGDIYLPVTVIRTSFDLFRGDTAFRPVDWRVRVQPAFSFNFSTRRKPASSTPTSAEGRRGFRSHLGLQEAFVEAKLFDLSSNYDFISVRAGVQELSTRLPRLRCRRRAARHPRLRHAEIEPHRIQRGVFRFAREGHQQRLQRAAPAPPADVGRQTSTSRIS